MPDQPKADQFYLWVANEDTNHRWRIINWFDTAVEAIRFAKAEVGSPWVVSDVCDSPVAFGDYAGKRGVVAEVGDF